MVLTNWSPPDPYHQGIYSKTLLPVLVSALYDKAASIMKVHSNLMGLLFVLIEPDSKLSCVDEWVFIIMEWRYNALDYQGN